MAAIGVGKGNNVTCFVITGTIASDVAMAGILMRMYSMSWLGRSGAKRVRAAVKGLPAQKALGTVSFCAKTT